MVMSKADKKSLKKTDLVQILEEKEGEILRLRADFENYTKHLNREREAFMKLANEDLVLKLLGIVDDFERALPLITDRKAQEGVSMIYRNFVKILEESGLKKIAAVGKKFDPYYHEALMQEDSPEEDGMILAELQVGYILKDKVIRHSKVKIAKNIGYE